MNAQRNSPFGDDGLSAGWKQAEGDVDTDRFAPLGDYDQVPHSSRTV